MDVIDYLSSPETGESRARDIFENLEAYKSLESEEGSETLVGRIYNWFMDECVQANQYLFISQTVYAKVVEIYRDLVAQLKAVDSNRASALDEIRAIVASHRGNLANLLKSIPSVRQSTDLLVPCAEYSLELQQRILRLGKAAIAEPVLDIGCGRNATVVSWLRLMGVEAYGIDQYLSDSEYVQRCNWLEYDYCARQWGTIYSHMAFSNHFNRSISLADSLSERYLTKLLEIAESLRVGGCFVFSPSIPDIESVLPKSLYSIEYQRNVMGNPLLDTTRLVKIGNPTA